MMPTYATYHYVRKLVGEVKTNISKIRIFDVVIFIIILAIIIALTLFMLSIMAKPYNLCLDQGYTGNISLKDFCPFGDGFLGCKSEVVVECDKLDQKVGTAIGQIWEGITG